MHNIRMILPFPQFAADKPNRDHRSVAPHHLSLIFQVQLRELLANLWCNFWAVFVRLVRVENFNGFRRKNRSKPNGKKTCFFLCEVNKGIRQATRSSPVFIFSLPSLSLALSHSIPLPLSQTSLFHRGFVKLLLQANSVPCKNHLLSFKTSPFKLLFLSTSTKHSSINDFNDLSPAHLYFYYLTLGARISSVLHGCPYDGSQLAATRSMTSFENPW